MDLALLASQISGTGSSTDGSNTEVIKLITETGSESESSTDEGNTSDESKTDNNKSNSASRRQMWNSYSVTFVIVAALLQFDLF